MPIWRWWARWHGGGRCLHLHCGPSQQDRTAWQTHIICIFATFSQSPMLSATTTTARPHPRPHSPPSLWLLTHTHRWLPHLHAWVNHVRVATAFCLMYASLLLIILAYHPGVSGSDDDGLAQFRWVGLVGVRVTLGHTEFGRCDSGSPGVQCQRR
jgi:hypothetical protein